MILRHAHARLGISLLACLVLISLLLSPCRAQDETTIAVLNFSNRAAGQDDGPYRWLEKGLADLLISDMASDEELRVVTREHMQMLLNEAEVLSTRRLPDLKKAALIKALRVHYMVFGTFALRGEKLSIEVQLTDVQTGRLIKRAALSGTLDEVLELEKSLAGTLIAELRGTADGADIAEALPRWTDSVPAVQHLYQGIDLFDRGLYPAAWLHFHRAKQQDPNFADARYWLARINYYRQEYGHARVEYERFVTQFPQHPRVGDAITELVHSFERTTDDPDALMALYTNLRVRPWPGNRVYHHADYSSWSPLSDWLLKRQSQVLTFRKEFAAAFELLASGIGDAPPYDSYAGHSDFGRKARPWQKQSTRLMAAAAQASGDRFGRKLTSPYLPYVDIVLTPEHPRVSMRIPKEHRLFGTTYAWSHNYRISAVKGFVIKRIIASIDRTNDPNYDSGCRLQVRRYRYVDISTAWTDNESGTQHTITMPPGCTWFYLRPEYLPIPMRVPKGTSVNASFDGWTVEAELEPLGPVGRVDLKVTNCGRHKAFVDGAYVRCYDGVLANLSPGKHSIEVQSLWPSDLDGARAEVDIKAGQLVPLTLSLPLNAKARGAGWQDPVSIADKYPWFKHRPKRDETVWGSRPSLCRSRSGRFVAIWSHLDDLWLATSEDGSTWDGPVNVPLPVNSAHVEMSPCLIEDESGRYCLIFLSDRGMLRQYATYASWSKDLTNWSRPVLIDATYHTDHAFVQGADGRYVIVAIKYVNRNKRVVTSQVSDDLRRWSHPRHVAGAKNPHRVAITQDRHGTFHLAWTRYHRTYYAASADLQRWTAPTRLPIEARWTKNSIAARVVGERLVVGTGAVDGGYSGSETTHLGSRPLKAAQAEWQSMDIPKQVVDVFFDFIYDPDTDDVVFVWQTNDNVLDATLPSGPVFALKGQRSKWFAEQPGESP
jgi:TolB-like protein